LSSLQNPEISGLIAIIDPANLASKKILTRRVLLHVSSEALTVCPVKFGNGQCKNRPAYNARCSLIAGLLLSRFVRFGPGADVSHFCLCGQNRYATTGHLHLCHDAIMANCVYIYFFIGWISAAYTLSDDDETP
jgi:hypothetical protein